MFNHLNVAETLPKLSRKNIDGSRLYETPDGKHYPSVTTITGQLSKDSILAWRRRVGDAVANKISGKASSRGTRIHSLAENYLLNNQVVPTQPLDQMMFRQLQNVLDKYVQNVHALEAPLYSHHLRTAGTVDCIAEFAGKLAIIDFKTSAKPKPEKWIQNYFVQCSAYAVMYEELTGTPVKRLVIIIGVDGEDEAQIFVKSRNDYIDQFIQLRDQYELTMLYNDTRKAIIRAEQSRLAQTK